ncbi:MAG: hypothetical protein NTZ19_08230 [Bacteroidetes bacterium]|nr:hypothetical protein [Bacteroidota bacterium]
MNKSNLHIKFLACLLIIAFFAQTFSKGLIIANYYTNTQAYAKNCINKAKPKMHCNGKCQMMKKLKTEENKDRQNPDRKNEVKTDLLYFAQIKQQIAYQTILNKKVFPLVQYKLTQDISADFFHPPSAA